MMSISNFFKKESENIIQKLKDIDSEITSLESFITSEGKYLGFIHSIEKQKNDMLEIIEKEKQLLEKKEISIKEVSKTTSLLNEKKLILKKFLEDKRWVEMESITDEIENLENEIFSLKYKIQAELAPIKRPFKKTKHVLTTMLFKSI